MGVIVVIVIVVEASGVVHVVVVIRQKGEEEVSGCFRSQMSGMAEGAAIEVGTLVVIGGRL